MNSYSIEQVAEFLGISVEGARNYKKRHQRLFIEGQHYYKDSGSLYYTDEGVSLIRQLRGEDISDSPEKSPEPQSGSDLLGTLVSHFRPILKPLARAIAGPLREELQDEVLSALFEGLEPLREQESYAILNRYGLLPGIDLAQLPTGTAGYLGGSEYAD